VRILMLAQFYPPTIGGEEQHVRGLAVALAARGHEVAVATLWHEGLPEYEVDEGVRVYRIRGALQRARGLFSESGRRHAPPFPDPGATWALREVVRRERPDVVHAHNWLVRSFLPIKTQSGAPLVMTLHDYSLVCARKNLMYHDAPCSGPAPVKCLVCASDHYGVAKGVPTALANAVMGHVEHAAVDMYIAVSRATAAGCRLANGPWPYRVIPNFIPDDVAERRDDAHPLLDRLPADGYLLFVGDLNRRKGVDVLLQAYARLAGAPPLVLIGRECVDTPTQLPPNVVMLHSWPHDAVMAAWRRSSVALAPSVWPETFGIVALEAMALGRPVIASRIGGLADLIVDDESGFLLPPGDVDALRATLARMLASPELVERLGQGATRRAAEYHVSAVVPRIESVYRDVRSPAARSKRSHRDAALDGHDQA